MVIIIIFDVKKEKEEKTILQFQFASTFIKTGMIGLFQWNLLLNILENISLQLWRVCAKRGKALTGDRITSAEFLVFGLTSTWIEDQLMFRH